MTARHIICAVRGRPTSRATVTYAIDHALESGARLTFFHVITAEFVAHATIGPLSVVYRELRDMSEFMMLLLCDRARRRGVQQVDYALREGNIRKQLRQFILEAGADVLVMGKPSPAARPNIFSARDLQAFVDELETSAGVRVVLVEPEDEDAPDDDMP